MKLTNEDYVMITSNATPLGLVILNFDLTLRNIHEAKEFLENGDSEQFDRHIQLAKSCLMLLMSSLDMKFDIAVELMELYLFANKLLIKGQFEKNTDRLCDACDILGSLADSFRAIAKEEKTQKPVMENVERLIEGFSYKGGKICEFSIGDELRGIKA